MESLGEKLKSAREAKDLSFDQISRETNIAARYLEALEAENFSGFPGEPYIIGFLRNYGAYLDLDVQGLLSLYRAYKIQEQPVPVEALLKSPSSFFKIFISIFIIVVVLGAAVGGVFFFLSRPKKAESPAPAGRQASEHVMSGDSLERRFYRGDSVLVSLGANQYKMELSSLGEVVTLNTPGGALILDLGQEANVDLDNDGISDLRITASDFVKNKADTGALLRLDRSNVPVVPAAASPPLPAETDNAAGLANATVIFSSPNAYPFTLQLNFQGYCLFRWEILFERDRSGRNERYFQRDGELSIQAQNGVRLGVSNAQTAKLQVIGGGRTVSVELGGAGEVVAADIRWVRDEENRYRLVLVRLE
ncbi:MAG: helix-turn-helix domain-containing protein [Treponema sp.]|nr:helix-turn-helix domain-containing protein [Treponema sp.]